MVPEMKEQEMLDGIRVDRRVTLLIEDVNAVEAFLADVRRGKIKFEDVRLVTNTPQTEGRAAAALEKMVEYIMKNSRPGPKLMKKQRKTDRKVGRPNWRK